MASRPVFVPSVNGGLVIEHAVEFQWFPGFAVAQKQRSVASLHRSATEQLGLDKVLEVSTKSMDPFGTRLSAFNLSVRIDAEPSPVLLEAAYQGSKVFESQDPLTHLYRWNDGREVKRFMRAYSKDRLVRFEFCGYSWPLEPRTAFYDWLYLNSLRELTDQDDDVNRVLHHFDAFTDIEFNPDKSFNCQARSCALYVALEKSGDLALALTNPDTFIELLTTHGYGVEPSQNRLL
ncbi:DarT1-associated NADAR antitoxin family protein [Candidatus Poriferisodalis sp.]|uniref:DarT1-associated NADAR antitoxin family protein n=1 Tax=Candidatus Poriferisodalis sp. TaxID=3101277 RepID=UPI003D1473A4